jgi:hypothetical protein
MGGAAQLLNRMPDHRCETGLPLHTDKEGNRDRNRVQKQRPGGQRLSIVKITERRLPFPENHLASSRLILRSKRSQPVLLLYVGIISANSEF